MTAAEVTAVDILEDVAPPIEGTVPSMIGAGVSTTEQQEQGTPQLADMLPSQKAGAT